ncbi:MAG: glycosyltransferase [Bacteroidota bacterium]
MNRTATSDLVCFSHHRWGFVCLRPQHLLSRFARQFRVFYIEEPVFDAMRSTSALEVVSPVPNLWVVTPHLQEDLYEDELIAIQKEQLSKFFIDREINHYLFWYYTPAAVAISDQFNPSLIVYDCMHEFAASNFALPDIKERELELFSKADIVFTSGHSLYEAKRHKHSDVHAFPNSIDNDHFYKARLYTKDLKDQVSIPHPRLGYCGVIDERTDLKLIEGIARRKPDWHIIMLGPIVRIEEKELPVMPNIHYLGLKPYHQLPDYLSGWDIAMLPFVHNETTRFINPTKTSEYLAAGKPVISTPINDVIRRYGNKGLVNIAGTPDEFVKVAEQELFISDRDDWLQKVNEFLSQNSWSKTWQSMLTLVEKKMNDKARNRHEREYA